MPSGGDFIRDRCVIYELFVGYEILAKWCCRLQERDDYAGFFFVITFYFFIVVILLNIILGIIVYVISTDIVVGIVLKFHYPLYAAIRLRNCVRNEI